MRRISFFSEGYGGDELWVYGFFLLGLLLFYFVRPRTHDTADQKTKGRSSKNKGRRSRKGRQSLTAGDNYDLYEGGDTSELVEKVQKRNRSNSPVNLSVIASAIRVGFDGILGIVRVYKPKPDVTEEPFLDLEEPFLDLEEAEEEEEEEEPPGLTEAESVNSEMPEEYSEDLWALPQLHTTSFFWNGNLLEQIVEDPFFSTPACVKENKVMRAKEAKKQSTILQHEKKLMKEYADKLQGGLKDTFQLGRSFEDIARLPSLSRKVS